MENQNDSAVKTEDLTTKDTVDVDEEVVIAEGDETDVDQEFTDTDETADETDDNTEKAEEEKQGKENKPKQSKEDNKKFAEKRRSEKAQKEEAELNFLKEYVGVNPFTNEKIENLRDAKVYKTMKMIHDKGGDPVMDYHKYAGIEEQKIVDNEKARTEKIKKEVEEFRTAYPDVNLNTLNQDKDFVKFSNKLLGRVSLKDVYELYNETKNSLKADAETKAKTEVARKIAKDNSSAGNLATVGDAGAPKYTMEQIGKMSKSEIDKNWKDVETSYNYWQTHRK